VAAVRLLTVACLCAGLHALAWGSPAASGTAPAIDAGARLRSGLFNPMPGGRLAGYRGDTGLDIAGSPRPVYAIAAGKLDYAETGHTLWTGRRDSPYCVRLELDVPIAWTGGRRITHAYYAHLSSVRRPHREGMRPRPRLAAGEMLGTSGQARGVPHLHLGLLLDGQVEQDSWQFILREWDVRKVLGGYRTGELLRAPVRRP
jgi:murein DD-endopeptidase MepM/ murein hydrolase activator NlpD